MFKNHKNNDIFGCKTKILTNFGPNWVDTPDGIALVLNRAVSCLTRRFEIFLSRSFFRTPCNMRKILNKITPFINAAKVLILQICKTCFKSRRYCAICNGLINKDNYFNFIHYSNNKHICTFLCRIFYSKV